MDFTTDRETSERLVEKYGVPDVMRFWYDRRNTLGAFLDMGRGQHSTDWLKRYIPAFELPHLLALAGLDKSFIALDNGAMTMKLVGLSVVGITVASLAALLPEE